MIRRLSRPAVFGLLLFTVSCAPAVAPKPQPAPVSDDQDQQNWTGLTTEFRATSTPSGAAVKFSSGENCKTPCSVKKPITENFDVTVSKNGFRSKTVSIISHQNVVTGSGASGKPKLDKPHLSPNPLAVTLEPVWDR